MPVIDDVRLILASALGLGSEADELGEDTALLGHFPQLDSMAVVAVITALEEQFEIEVDDDELSAENFESVGALCAFVEGKLGR